MNITITDDEVLEQVRRCNSMDELHCLWREYAERIVANPKLNAVYNDRAMSLDGP